MTTNDKYFIVENDDLTKYGQEDGMTLEEAVSELERIEDNTERADMVVIKGRVITPRVQVKVVLE